MGMRGLSAVLATAVGVAAAQDTLTIDVDVRSVKGPPIAPNFVGFSIEVPAALSMMGADGTNAVFASLLEQLYTTTAGPHPGPNLRLGGNSADSTCYVPEGGSAPDGCSATINISTLQAYRTFAETTAAAANVSFVIGTNFGLSPDPNLVASGHVRGLGEAGLWPKVRAVEVGNEMDIYAGHANLPGKPHHRNASYSFADYMVEFKTFLAAYREVGMPDRRVQGGTWAGTAWYPDLPPYLAAYGNQMAAMSLHKYAQSTCGGNTVTIADLLADRSAAGAVGKIGSALQHNSPGPTFVIGEGNSASCGGQSGVSDTFASTLWVMDFLPSLSKVGVRSMNFHGGPGGPYAPIAFAPTFQVRPIFYGLMVFSELIANYSQWVSVEVSGADPAQSDPTCKTGILGGKSGSPVCCAAACGTCGGTGCNNLPGGSAACCGGTIASANRTCTQHLPPCVPDRNYMSSVTAHAVTSSTDRKARVLLIAKKLQSSSVSANLCLQGVSSPKAETKTILSPSGVAAKSAISFGGLSWDNSTTGRPSGNPSIGTVRGSATSSGMCFVIELEPLSAVLVTVSLDA